MANFKIEEFYKDTMKTYLNYSQNNQINNNALLMQKRKHVAEQAKKNTIARENNELNRPARAISFGGSASLTKKATRAFNKTVEFVYKNEAAYNAIYAWIVAGILKPMAVLNMPGSEEKDKQIVATKNFLQAFIGGFLGLTIGGGLVKKSIDVVKNNLKLIKVNKDGIEALDSSSKQAREIAKGLIKDEKKGLGEKFKRASQAFSENNGVDKVKSFFKTFFEDVKYKPTEEEISAKAKEVAKNFKDNHFKYFKNNESFTKLLISKAADAKSNTTYQDAFETLWKNSTGAVTAILKAKVSSLLLPGVMAFLFAKKNLEKAQKEQALKAQDTTLTNNNSFKSQQAYYQRMMNKNNNLAFQGNILNKSIDGLARGVEYLGMSKVGEKLAKTLAKAKKPSARMSDIESFAITAYWLQNTARNEKIEPSQRLGLNVHSALVTVVSSTAAFFIDWALDGLINNSQAKHFQKLAEISKTALSNNSKDITSTLKEQAQDILGADKIVETLSETLTLDRQSANQAMSKIEDVAKIIDRKNIKKTLLDIKKENAPGLLKEIANLTEAHGKKLSKFKSLTIFTLVVRFLVPVLMVPFSGKLKKKIVEHAEKRQQAKATA